MIKKGEIVYGKVTNILGYGAFVTVDNYDGLIHISEFSDNFVRSIKDYVTVGQQVKLKVLDVDEGKKTTTKLQSIEQITWSERKFLIYNWLCFIRNNAKIYMEQFRK